MRASTVLLREAPLAVGLSGGERSVFGVMLMSAFDRFDGASDSFSDLSKIEPRTSLSGESDMTVNRKCVNYETSIVASSKIEAARYGRSSLKTEIKL